MATQLRSGRPRSVVILGGGPAGATAGTLLARAGVEVVIFAPSAGRPEIVIGESLVPAVVPYLRELDVEEEVASYSIRKEGATFIFNREAHMSIRFDEVRGAKTVYSYNTPRDRFDASVLGAAVKAGCTLIDANARLERVADSDRVALAAASLEACGLSEQPDFVIDAGGRRRNVARLMGVECIDGERRDTALHAHFEGIEVEVEGNVHTDRLTHGWNWRIPLPGKVSLGVVIDTDYIKKFGDTPEEQLDALLQHDPVIRDYAAPARRVTPVVKYSNYQSRAVRGYGENWALVGDAFGFVDPVFSSGTAIAFESATHLANALLEGSPEALEKYQRDSLHIFSIWAKLIDWFYSGRLFTLFRVGQEVRKTWLGKMVDWHFRKHMPKIFTGEDVTNAYSVGLVEFMVKNALRDNDPEENRIL